MTRVLLILLLVSACAAPVPQVPKLDLPPRFAATAPERVAGQPFWTAFRDPKLDALVQAGLGRNLSIAEATAVVDEAEADLRLATAPGLPTLSLGLGATRGLTEGALITSGSAGLATSWMADLFGGTRAAREAALAELDSAQLSHQAARTTVAGAITLAYLDLRFAEESIALTRQSLESRREALRLMQALAEQGQTGRLGVLQAEQAIAEAEAALPPLQIARDQAINRLARLTAGRAADPGPGGQPVARGKPSVGVPADVIRGRPDVQIAERGLAAALARVGVAEAAFWPSVSLSGSITPTVQRGGGRQTPWSLGPRIDLPIFAGGARSAALSGAEARAVQAESRWRAAALAAIEEVENGLSAWARGRTNVAAQRRLVAAGEETVALARATWTAGSGDIFTVLKAEQDLLAARSALASALRDQAAAYVGLSIAAGGSSQ